MTVKTEKLSLEAKQAETEELSEAKILNRLTWGGFLGNVFLAVFKLLAGIFGSSIAMLSDAIHSISHVFTTLIALAGVKAGEKEADDRHPYGHERMECIASLILGLVLVVAACDIAWNGLSAIVTGSYKTMETPGVLALVAAAVSILVNEGMYLYIRYYAEKIHSSAFMAAAVHDHADSLSSVGSFVGILGAMAGFPIMDSVAALAICLFLFKSAYDILKEALDEMLDVSGGTDFDRDLTAYISGQAGVTRVDLLKSRLFGSRIYVDLEIGVDGDWKLKDAHAVAQRVHDNVEKEFPRVKHIMIHVNPA